MYIYVCVYINVLHKLFENEIAVGRRPPTGKSLRFVRVVRAGEAELHGGARQKNPPLQKRNHNKCCSSARPAVRRAQARFVETLPPKNIRRWRDASPQAPKRAPRSPELAPRLEMTEKKPHKKSFPTKARYSKHKQRTKKPDASHPDTPAVPNNPSNLANVPSKKTLENAQMPADPERPNTLITQKNLMP